MAANWGVIESRTESGHFVAYHVVPLIDCDGESICSAAHDLDPNCQCHPFYTLGGSGLPSQLNRKRSNGKLVCWQIWQHFDPDHPGALSIDEWRNQRRMAMAEAAHKEVRASIN
jgi:hypothetical protein